MKHIGYINSAQNSKPTTEIIDLMHKNGCSTIHVEQPKGKERPAWTAFIDSLENGNSAVLQSFDNAFHNFNDMIFFVKYCSKKNIRIVSLDDGLDTHDKLFPERTTSDTLDLVCRIFGKRDKASHDDLGAELYSNQFKDRKLKRFGLVINMYKAGYKVAEIMRRTGYRSKGNIYRVLHMYDIQMAYPAMSRAKDKVEELSV